MDTSLNLKRNSQGLKEKCLESNHFLAFGEGSHQDLNLLKQNQNQQLPPHHMVSQLMRFLLKSDFF